MKTISDYEQLIIDSLFETYSTVSGFSVKDIKGKRRFRRLCKARHELMQQIRQCTSLSYIDIGKIFNRNHSTVIAAIRKWEQ